jgi:hypothetical protein
MGRGAGEARVQHDDIGALRLLALEDVLERDRMRLGRIRAHEDHGLRVADVVVAVRHGAVAPGVRDARHRGGVADARLVVDVVRAPEGRELAEEVGAFVRELGRAEQVDRIRAGPAPDLEKLFADLGIGLIPGDPLPGAADLLHRILDPAVAVHQLAYRSALGAMGAAVDRARVGGLLADPDAVLDLGLHRAAHRAVGADVGADLDRLRMVHRPGLDPARHARAERAERGEAPDRQARGAQETAAVERAGRHGGGHLREPPGRGGVTCPAFDEHQLVPRG